MFETRSVEALTLANEGRRSSVWLCGARCVVGGVSRARGQAEEHVFHSRIHAFPDEAWTPRGAWTPLVKRLLLWRKSGWRTTNKQPRSSKSVSSGAGLNVSKSLVLRWVWPPTLTPAPPPTAAPPAASHIRGTLLSPWGACWTTWASMHCYTLGTQMSGKVQLPPIPANERT